MRDSQGENRITVHAHRYRGRRWYLLEDHITVDPLIDPASGTFRVQLVMTNPGNRIPAGLRCSAQKTR